MTTIYFGKICRPRFRFAHSQIVSGVLRMLQTVPLSGIFIKPFHSSSIWNVQGLAIRMPSLSPTMMEGSIVKWLKKEGDSITPGDILCDIQTDKAVVSFETDEEGILARILKGDDSKDVKIGTLIALMVQEGEDWKSVEMPGDADVAEESTIKSPIVQPSESPKLQHPSHNYGPSVRLLLEKYGLHQDQVSAHGPKGILLKGDILKHVKERNIHPKPISIITPTETPEIVSKPAIFPSRVISAGDKYDDVELTNMRKTIAKRLSQSKSMVPHTYSTMECSVDVLLRLRKQFQQDGVSVSINDFIIKSVAIALIQCPDINCVWEGGQLMQKKEVDISVAVATDAGLITPIVKGADGLGLQSISKIVRDLALRARENKLKLHEFQGGTFTISNLGMFGIKEFTAIINQPQCAILAVGGNIFTLGADGKAESRMRATLSYDQAAISDDSAALFLKTLQNILENPQEILLGSYSRSDPHPLAALL